MDIDAIRDRVGTLVAVGLVALIVGAFALDNDQATAGVIALAVGAVALLLAAVGWLVAGSR